MFNNRYDLGDLIASILLTYGLSTVTGLGSSSLFGVAFSDRAVQLGGTIIPISVVAIAIAVGVAFATNTQLSVAEFRMRPGWEKAFAVGTVLVPLAFQFVPGMHDWMTASYVNGSLVAAVVLVGFIIVGYRRGNDKKHALTSAHKAITGSR